MQEVAYNLIKKKYEGYSIYSLPIWGMKTRKNSLIQLINSQT